MEHSKEVPAAELSREEALEAQDPCPMPAVERLAAGRQTAPFREGEALRASSSDQQEPCFVPRGQHASRPHQPRVRWPRQLRDGSRVASRLPPASQVLTPHAASPAARCSRLPSDVKPVGPRPRPSLGFFPSVTKSSRNAGTRV